MRRIVAFLCAIMLTIATLFAWNTVSENQLLNNIDYIRTDTNRLKYLCYDALTASLNDKSIPIFGSSELDSITDSNQYVTHILNRDDINVVPIGTGGYQSLIQSMILGAIGNKVSSKKIVFILSPQWFNTKGMNPIVMASLFNDSMLIKLLKNNKVSTENKQYVLDRLKVLLKDYPEMEHRISVYEDTLMKKQGFGLGTIYTNIQETYRQKGYNAEYLKKQNMFKGKQALPVQSGPIDFTGIYQEAISTTEKMMTNNSYGMTNAAWNYYSVKAQDKLKFRADNSNSPDSPEFNDFIHFLRIAKDMGLQTEVINVPINGYWEDYLGVDWTSYYARIREITAQEDVYLTDLSSYNYDMGFLTDTIHLGWKGWTVASEEIYKFSQGV